MRQEIRRRLSQGWDDRSKSRSKDFALEVCIPTRFQALRIFVCVKHINRWQIHFGSLPTSTNHVTYRIALGRLCRGATQECLLTSPAEHQQAFHRSRYCNVFYCGAPTLKQPSDQIDFHKFFEVVFRLILIHPDNWKTAPNV